jgi:hypothetical protein
MSTRQTPVTTTDRSTTEPEDQHRDRCRPHAARRIAVVRPEGSRFNIISVGAAIDARRRLDARRQ